MASIEDLWYDANGNPTGRHGKGKRWQARWRDPAGQSRRRAFAKKTQAQRHVTAVEHAKIKGTYLDARAGEVPLRELVEAHLASLTSGPTTRGLARQHAGKHIVPLLGDVHVGTLARKPSLIKAWLAGRSAELSPGTVANVLGLLTSVLDTAVEDGLIPANPCRVKSLRPPRNPKGKVEPWPDEWVDALVAAYPVELRALPLVAAYQGLRRGELLGLELADVDFLHRVLHVRRQVRMETGGPTDAPPKGGKPRDVPLADEIGLLLSTATEGRLWPLRPDVLRKTHLAALRKAGIPVERRNGLHALRHYAASVWLHEGVDVRAVAEYLGHDDPAFTLRTYVHLIPRSDERMRKAVSAAWRAPGVPLGAEERRTGRSEP